MKHNVRKMTLSAMFLALCLLLPFLTGQIPQIGNVLAPMHIPVLLCGFVCGWPYGLVVGFMAPLLRFMLFGMPPLFPIGVAMAFELATYGFLSGVFYQLLPKRLPYLYLNLIFSMLIGRLVWGAVQYVIAGLHQTEFTFAIFVSAAFVKAIPGIILQLVLIPLIILLLRKAKLMLNE